MGKTYDNKYIYTCYLKQMTPMIHFQSDEPGAIIRASELKPKLDRFILSKVQENVSDDWYLCQDKEKRSNNALNYKVRITVNGTPKKSEERKLYREYKSKLAKTTDENEKKEIKRAYQNNPDRINNMYFGNMASDEKQYKETIMYEENEVISLTIICFIPELMKRIEECLEEFFLVTNFGTRQSKGFGGFVISKEYNTLIQILQNAGYSFLYVDWEKDVDFSKMGQLEKANYMLNYAKVIYSVMKSGINNKFGDEKGYIRGYIRREYLSDSEQTNCGSEKAYIKNSFNTKLSIKYEPQKYKYDNYCFVRALLGLPDNYRFQGNKTIKIKNKEIERFQSPVTIKVIDNYLIFLMNDSYKEILGKNFEFLLEEKKGKNREVIGRVNITVPEKFDHNDFLKKFAEYFNNKKNKESYNFSFPKQEKEYNNLPKSYKEFPGTLKCIIPQNGGDK